VTYLEKNDFGRDFSHSAENPAVKLSSKESAKDPTLYSDWLTLLGYFEEAEALQYVQGQGVPPITTSDEWREGIKKARAAVSGLSGRSKMQPEVRALGDEFETRFAELRQEPTFQEHTIGMKSTSFALVELNKIHCFQRHLNVEYVEALAEKAPSREDLAGLVSFCLPTRNEILPTPITAGFNPNTNTFTAVTQNLDLRVAGTFQGQDPSTHRAMAGFTYGFGLPQISVVEYKGYYLLKNGYHRAYALLMKGHEFMPCIVQSTDVYQLTGGQVPGFFPIDLVISDRSPLLSDFTTEAAVPVPRRRLRVMVSVHAELQAVPL